MRKRSDNILNDYNHSAGINADYPDYAEPYIAFPAGEKIKQVCGWIEENDVSEHDFEVQREVYYMLHDMLKKREERHDR